MADVTPRTKRRRIQNQVNEHMDWIDTEAASSLGDDGRDDCLSQDDRYSNLQANLSPPIYAKVHVHVPSSPIAAEPFSEQEQSDTDSSSQLLQDSSSNSYHLDSLTDRSLPGSEDEFQDDLADWAAKYSVTHSALSGLLGVLRKKYHPNLPKDPRTLLGTMTNIQTETISGGSYYHVGIKKGILSALDDKYLVTDGHIKLQINVDGLPLFKSSGAQFWPVLGMLPNCTSKKPFVIGLFYGNGKPTSLEYLQDFVTEARQLESDGFIYNKLKVVVVISAIMCDAPARAFIKNVKGHSGYGGCDKCIQHGVYLEKVTFPETDAPLRTDQSFKEMTDEVHHLGPSPLAELNIGMVSAFPMDYMHLVCLGVMKRLLRLWVEGPLKNRLGPRVIEKISSVLVSLRPCIPCEFARKPRSIKELKRWKATEFRQFLLYTGPLSLLSFLPDILYTNFMLFLVALFLLLSPSLCDDYCQFAHDLLVLFVKHFGQIYGQSMITYNVHGLVHLSEEVKRYGSLDNISCFPFENFLGQLKRMVRKPQSPLEQVIRRLSEQRQTAPPASRDRLQNPHSSGPLPREFEGCPQFSQLHRPDCIIKTLAGDNCVQIDGSVAVVRNLCTSGTWYLVLGCFSSIGLRREVLTGGGRSCDGLT